MYTEKYTSPTNKQKEYKMTNINQLKAELEIRRVAKIAELAELKETILLNHELTKLDSPLYTSRELAKEDNIKLDVIIDQIAESYATNDRKMSLVFGYGVIPNKILQICNAIRYSKAEEKEEFLLLTGLDEQIIEDTLDTFGSTAYFSKLAIDIIPAIEMNIIKSKELLKIVATDMGLVSELDLSKFNKANVDYQYKRAQMKAEEMLENTKEYVTTALSYDE